MRCLLVDDHVLFREGLALLLAANGFELSEAGSHADALRRLADAESGFDVALVDLSMPGDDAFTGIAQLTAQHPGMPVLVVSASSEPRDVRRARSAGARGYVTKASGSALVLEAVRALTAGGTYWSPDVAVATEIAEGPGSLTPRQREVLALLREGLSNKEIGLALDLAEITVKLHVGAILRALGVRNRTEAAILAADMERAVRAESDAV
ncbi:MAG: response regulator transcription factor [Alphaproteobacteria bacterium]|nr:response regulator transcription factor [Alphaproteobacteria bacterium]